MEGEGIGIDTAEVSFPVALNFALVGGHRIRRAGWNGKGMFVYLHRGSAPPDVKASALPGKAAPRDGDISVIDGIPNALFDTGDEGTAVRLPSMAMRTASGSTVIGWLASQADMCAVDWEVLA